MCVSYSYFSFTFENEIPVSTLRKISNISFWGWNNLQVSIGTGYCEEWFMSWLVTSLALFSCIWNIHLNCKPKTVVATEGRVDEKCIRWNSISQLVVSMKLFYLFIFTCSQANTLIFKCSNTAVWMLRISTQAAAHGGNIPLNWCQPESQHA